MHNKLKKIIPLLLIFLLTIIYLFKAYQLFSEVPIFITEGSSYIVKILEFTNYRPLKLSYIFIEYFILISIYGYIYCFVYYKSTNKNNLIKFIFISNIIMFIILFIISNIFFPIYIILYLLANILVIASFYISKTLWGSKIHFKKGDILFQSIEYQSEIEAIENLNEFLKNNELYLYNDITGNVFQDNDYFYFEISSLDNISLDRKGVFKFYENN